MIVAGWADGYRNNSFRTVERARRGTASRTGCWPARGRTPTRRPRCPGPRIDLDVEMAAWFDHWLRGTRRARTDRRRRVRARLDAARARPRPARGLLGPTPAVRAAGHRGDARTLAGAARRWPSCPTSAPPRGSTARATCRGGCPATSACDDARSLTWEVRRRPTPVVGHPACGLRLSVDRAGGVAVGEAVRRLPRRHLGPGHARHASTSPSATACTAPPSPLVPGARVRRRGGARRVRLRVAPGQTLRLSRRRRRLAEHRSLRPAPVSITVRTGALDAAAAGRRVPRARRSRRARSTPRSRPRASAGRSTTTCCAGPRPRTTRSDVRATPRRTTGPRTSTTSARCPSTPRTFAQRAQRQHRLRADLARHRRHGPLDDDARRDRRRRTTCRSGPRPCSTASRSASGPGRSRSLASRRVGRGWRRESLAEAVATLRPGGRPVILESAGNTR